MVFRITVAAVVAIILVAEFYLSRYFYREWRSESKCSATVNWPTTEGTVVKSEVKPPLTRRRREKAVIEFQYVVNGKQHTSQSCRCGSELFGGYTQISQTERVFTSGAREARTRWPRGQSVTVAYNPNNHSESYIDYTKNANTRVIWVVFAAIGLFFGAVVIGMWLMIVLLIPVLCLVFIMVHLFILAFDRRALDPSISGTGASDNLSK